MGHIAISSQVHKRNGIGQFISECSAAASASVDEMLDEGVNISREEAPKGVKHDPRGSLEEGFFTHKLSRTSGVWGNDARHALPIELGAAPHVIEGSPYLHFYWEAAGRMWIPGLMGDTDIVNHPGNAAQPYLRPAYERVMARAMSIMRRYYPG